MSISSSQSLVPNQAFVQIKQDFQSLGSALQSGNLGAAQTAFSALLQAQQATPQSSGDTAGAAPSGSIASAVSALATDLQSGNLSGAQSAFQQIQGQLQSSPPSSHAHGHGSHHHHGGGGGAGALLSASSASSGSSGSAAAASGSAQASAFLQLIQSLQSVSSTVSFNA